ncbi:apolipoprotein N-acyltransferase [Basilea psittacipulmonis]|uniref:apolipoprotein N-acyltransferase n=1 Tax=Basilea psittacipulmonis TaxID=1472345 RepID=UPI0006902054|nr:apolipoprotein N-acyltransferase [Basilea psittacipulmonis]
MFAYFILLIAGAINAFCYSNDPISGSLNAPLQILTLSVLAVCTLLAKNKKMALTYGLTFGFISFVAGIYWIYISVHSYGNLNIFLSTLTLFLFAFYLAIYYGLACLLIRWLNKEPTLWSIFNFAAVWTIFEWLRGTLFTGFPWNNIAYAHVESILSGWAPLLGSYGVTFVAAFISACVAICFIAFLARHIPNIILSLLLILGIAIGSTFLCQTSWVTPRQDSITVRLIQPNSSIENKFSPLTQMQELIETLNLASRYSAVNKAQVIIFPETTIPIFQHNVPAIFWRQMIDIADYANTTLLIGAPILTQHQSAHEYANGIILIDKNTSIDDIYQLHIPHYNKRHLVPFGEYIPTGFRWFTDILQIPLGDFTAGAIQQKPFNIQGTLIGANICYENLFGHELIEDIKSGATVLVNISNLAWFGDSTALGQHLNISRMRSLELGRPMLLATNTGRTAYIDPKGKVIAALPTATKYTLEVNVTPYTGETPFIHWGDHLIITLSSLITLFFIALNLICWHRRVKAEVR